MVRNLKSRMVLAGRRHNPMTKESDAFEQQIHRLLEVIESSGAAVTWDDRIPDPDNPEQPRQIDITIKLDGTLTLVECRHHKERQNVQWIEELIGRKASLRAVTVIAVSSSGFTAGAIKRATAFGIVVRDLTEVTADEAKNWGCTMTMQVYYYQYRDLKEILFFQLDSIPRLDLDVLAKELAVYPGRQSLFNASAVELDRLNLLAQGRENEWIRFGIRLRLESFRLCGESVEEVEFSGRAKRVATDIILPMTLAYGDPKENPTERSTLIQKTSAGETGFITHNAAKVATIVDLSDIELPQNCQFRYVRTNASKTVDMESFELIGGERLCATGGPMIVEIASITTKRRSPLESENAVDGAMTRRSSETTD